MVVVSALVVGVGGLSASGGGGGVGVSASARRSVLGAGMSYRRTSVS